MQNHVWIISITVLLYEMWHGLQTIVCENFSLTLREKIIIRRPCFASLIHTVRTKTSKPSMHELVNAIMQIMLHYVVNECVTISQNIHDITPGNLYYIPSLYLQLWDSITHKPNVRRWNEYSNACVSRSRKQQWSAWLVNLKFCLYTRPF